MATVKIAAKVPLRKRREAQSNSKEKEESILETKSATAIISDLWAVAKEERLINRMFDPIFTNASGLLDKLLLSTNMAYPPQDVLQKVNLQKECDLMNQLRYAMKHALLASRPSSIAWCTGTWSLMFQSHQSVLEKYLGISNQDIIIDTCEKHTYTLQILVHEPGYYLVVDHDTKTIVLSISCSQSFGDAITDLNAIPCAFTVDNITGKVHEGMLQSAFRINNAITKTLLETCALYEDYNVVITGHSLGAGVAALLGLMYKDHPIIRQKHGLRVYAFASPCIVSKEFTDNEIGSDFITSIAVNCDMVTRLSVESFKKYNRRQDLVMNQKLSVVANLKSYCKGDLMPPEDDRTTELLNLICSASCSRMYGELYPLGRPLWFVPTELFEDKEMEPEIRCALRHRIGALNDCEAPKNKDQSENGAGHTLCDASSYRYVFTDLVCSAKAKSDHYPDVYLSICGGSL